ncbi:hypothetical protein CRUP_019723 [Coryphaenoides rupestris]|nr:hypothetical protein CRUP_019723 [Coryphaenoides rupestris]
MAEPGRTLALLWLLLLFLAGRSALWAFPFGPTLDVDVTPRTTVFTRGVLGCQRFRGSVQNYSTLLLDEGAGLLYVGGRGALYALDTANISAPANATIDWEASAEQKKQCLNKGRDNQTECYNHIRFLQHYNSTHLYVCGTHAFRPLCAYIDTERFNFSSGLEDGKDRCPYDPAKGFTGLLIGVLGCQRFRGSVQNYSTLLLDEGAGLLYVGGRGALYALDAANISAPANATTECYNHIRFLQHYNSTHLYVCGTHAFRPLCAYIDTERFNFSSGLEDGKDRCPYDPAKGFTGLLIEGEMFNGRRSNEFPQLAGSVRRNFPLPALRTEEAPTRWLLDSVPLSCCCCCSCCCLHRHLLHRSHDRQQQQQQQLKQRCGRTRAEAAARGQKLWNSSAKASSNKPAFPKPWVGLGGQSGDSTQKNPRHKMASMPSTRGNHRDAMMLLLLLVLVEEEEEAYRRGHIAGRRRRRRRRRRMRRMKEERCSRSRSTLQSRALLLSDWGGQRTLQRKWTTFLKARMVCSVPDYELHLNIMRSVFVLQGAHAHASVFYGVFGLEW